MNKISVIFLPQTFSTFFVGKGCGFYKKIFNLILFLFFLQTKISAQILDDSTKQVYSTKTVEYILEEDILNNRRRQYNPDTTLENFHFYNFKLKNGNFYQDLGNFGTAYKSIYYQAPLQIGRKFGVSIHDNYAFDGKNVGYFNTKSPYTNMNYVQANRGSGRLHFTHSQNINKQLNATLDVKRLTASKQYGSPQNNEDRMLDSWAFMIHSNYETKNKKYIILGNFNHFNHKPTEFGGFSQVNGKFIETKDFGNQTTFEQFSSNLTATTSREKWNDLHIYHQYKLGKGLEVYHVFDRQKRVYFYDDYKFRADSTSLKYYFITGKTKNDTLSQDLRYNLIENKFGLKGIYKGFAYRLHLRTRFYDLKDRVDEKGNISVKNETIAGAWANYYFPDSLRRAFAEAEIGSGGDYNLKVEYLSPLLQGGFQSIFYQPNIIDDAFLSKAFSWGKALKNTLSNNVYGKLNYKKGNFQISPSVHYSLITNFIYYNQEAKVMQDDGTFNLLRIGGNFEYRWKRWFFANQIFVSTQPKKDIFRVPVLANNSRIGLEFIYAKVLHINTGLDIYYRSRYKGDNYMPITRQFFLQNNQYIWGKPLVDFFADLKINKVRLFFKFENLPYGIIANGIYASATYPNLRQTFIMGVNWPLFD